MRGQRQVRTPELEKEQEEKDRREEERKKLKAKNEAQRQGPGLRYAVCLRVRGVVPLVCPASRALLVVRFRLQEEQEKEKEKEKEKEDEAVTPQLLFMMTLSFLPFRCLWIA